MSRQSRRAGLAFMLLLAAGVIASPHQAGAASCSMADARGLQVAEKSLNSAFDRCEAIALSPSTSLAQSCRACRAAQQQYRAFSRRYKTFKRSCAGRVGASDMQELESAYTELMIAGAQINREFSRFCP